VLVSTETPDVGGCEEYSAPHSCCCCAGQQSDWWETPNSACLACRNARS
jgi:hypothetical protein